MSSGKKESVIDQAASVSSKGYSFSTTGIPSRPMSSRIVAADTVHMVRRLAFNSGVSALFTEQLS